MADVIIKYNERDLKRVNKLLEAYPKAKPKVFSRAINKTAASARGKIVKELAGKTKLKQTTIRQSIRFFKASYRRWSALLRLIGRRLSVLRLKARQTKKGVTYMDPSTASRTLIPHAFIAEMPHGGSGVFLRLMKDRLPIEKQYAPSLAEIYNKAPEIVNRIQSETGRDLHKNVMAQIRLVLEKAR